MNKEELIELRTIAFQCATQILVKTEEQFCIHDVMMDSEEIVEYMLSGKIGNHPNILDN